MKQQVRHIRRKAYSLFLVLTAILSLSGCSDGFLKEQPVLQKHLGSIYVQVKNGEFQFLNIGFEEIQQASYQIRQYPKWIEFLKMNGTFSNGDMMLSFRILPGELPNLGNNSGDLILDIQGVGLASLRIIVEEQDPGLSIYIDPPALDFGTDLSNLSFRIHNASANGFEWRVTDCPEWIRLEGNSWGSIAVGELHNLYAKCIRTNLDPGSYNGQITIEITGYRLKITRNVAVSATVIALQNPANVTAIEGRVMDAVYCKQTDRLFVATQQPNKLLIYGKDEAVSEMALSKSPRRLSLSEDGKTLFVGHSGLVTCIDTDTRQIKRSYELDFSVFSLVYGENNWLYLSPDVEYASEPLICLNLTSGHLLRSRLENGYGRMNLLKVKGKPVLLYSRIGISPSGVALVDISAGAPGQEKYWHIDLGTPFAFSEDGKYLYGAYGYIFVTPDFHTGEDLLPLGRTEQYNRVNGMDHCAQTSSLWCALGNGDNPYVSRYHAGDYYLIESFPVSDYATMVNGVYDYYRTIPHYVFSDRMGEKVFIIRNVYTYGEEADAWSMETLHLKR